MVESCESCQFSCLVRDKRVDYEAKVTRAKQLADFGIDMSIQTVRLRDEAATFYAISTADLEGLPQPERDFAIDGVSRLNSYATDLAELVAATEQRAQEIDCGDHPSVSCPRYEVLENATPAMQILTKAAITYIFGDFPRI